ncbi:hypothetical protein GCM10029978_086550 [Actinoallomurus acanthiterrae]
MAGQDGLRASAARDKDFVGIDTAAMAQLIQQMTSASNAITAWLRTNAALPPSVPRTGLRQAAAVESWVSAQPGMLGRRRAYADAHLSKGAADMPRVGVGRLGGRPGRTTRPAPDTRSATSLTRTPRPERGPPTPPRSTGRSAPTVRSRPTSGSGCRPTPTTPTTSRASTPVSARPAAPT